MLDINVEKLNKVIEDFYNITGVMIGAYDINFNRLSTCQIEHCSLCNCVRKYDFLENKCTQCDIEGIKKCTSEKKTQIYLCHMGLIEAVTPIFADNVVAGYILIGQMLDEKNKRTVRENICKIKENVNHEELLKASENVPVLTGTKIDSIISLMIMCTKYLMVEKIVNVKSSLLSASIALYVEDNLGQNIGIRDICEHMHISRSKLYEVSTVFFKMGITDYIRQRRIERAKTYLKDTEISVNEISGLVGISDSDYFIKMFKKYVGITPSVYRKTKL